MDCPGVLTPVKKRNVQCGKYRLRFHYRRVPVKINAQDGPWKGGFWDATGEDAEEIIRYVNAGNLGRAEAYIDMMLEKGREKWERWNVRSVDIHDL